MNIVQRGLGLGILWPLVPERLLITLVSCLSFLHLYHLAHMANSSTNKLEAAGFSEMFVPVY
jgi:hypothetical protein